MGSRFKRKTLRKKKQFEWKDNKPNSRRRRYQTAFTPSTEPAPCMVKRKPETDALPSLESSSESSEELGKRREQTPLSPKPALTKSSSLQRLLSGTGGFAQGPAVQQCQMSASWTALALAASLNQ